MMNQYNGLPYGMGFGTPGWLPAFGLGIALLALWTIFWKGLALWHSAQRKQPWWFAIMLIVNTAGILEIIYLFAIAKIRFSDLFSNNPKSRT